MARRPSRSPDAEAPPRSQDQVTQQKQRETQKQKQRQTQHALRQEDGWNLTDLFESDTQAFDPSARQKLAAATDAFVAAWEPRIDYLEDPELLKQALDQYEAYSRTAAGGGSVAYYAFLRFSQEQSNPTVKAAYQQVDQFVREESNKLLFFEHRLAATSKKTQEKLLRSPVLEPYRHFLTRVFARGRYQLSEAEEKILTLTASPGYQQWVDLLDGLLAAEQRLVRTSVDGSPEKKELSSLLGLLDNPEKQIRDEAAAAVNDILASRADVAEAEINAVCSYKKTLDQLRGVDRPDRQRHLSDDMESEVVDALVGTVADQFSLAQDFYRLKADLLSQKQLAYHERNLPVGSRDQRYSWDQAATMVEDVLMELHPTFGKIMKQFVAEGRFDIYPRTGKSGGAFCASYLVSQPTYILLNHNGTLDDVLTLAHEVGHGINNVLIAQNQDALSAGTSTATAEVASTFMEDYVIRRLMRDADDQLRLSLQMHQLNRDVSSIMRQIAFYRFEQDLHSKFREEGYLSHTQIGALFQEHMESYMGPAVEQSPGSENWWIYVGHFRRFFYVYTYASGMMISKALQHRVDQDPAAIENVVEFLSTGRSSSPHQAFLKMGIDISTRSFWEDGVTAIQDLLTETKSLAKHLKKVQ